MDWGPIGPIQVGQTMTSWPAKQPGDIGWAYVSIGEDPRGRVQPAVSNRRPGVTGRLELMHRPGIPRIPDPETSREFIGYAHLGVELGSRAAVDALTTRLQGDGFPLLDGPRLTGDGYYESMIADPQGNRIVIAE